MILVSGDAKSLGGRKLQLLTGGLAPRTGQPRLLQDDSANTILDFPEVYQP
jgi:hypothetical protein